MVGMKAARARERCQQRGCKQQWITWCPLCQKMLCQLHDALTPRRMHDCIAGLADG
jgi:hypothetical protein